MAATSETVHNLRRALPMVLERTRSAISDNTIGRSKMSLLKCLETTPLKLFQVKLSDHDNALTWFHCGNVAYDKRQYRKALAAWKKAGGHAEAHYRIGQLYARGEGVVQSIPDAVVWHKRAADNGHVEAQYELGTIYHPWCKTGTQWSRQLAQVSLTAR